MPGLLIYNASSGTADKHPPEQLLEALRAGGDEVRLHEFTEGDEPAKIAIDAIAAGAKWIAVAGGDGTVECAAKALLDTRVPLGVIPCGTYNNFALSASIPADPLEACRLIAAGQTRAVDVGMVNGEPFFECVGAGLDAALFPLGDAIKDENAVTGAWKLLRRAASYPSHRFEIEFDRPLGEALLSLPANHTGWRLLAFRSKHRRHIRVRALMITVSNGPYYGMNFAVAPDARLDDGELTITIFKRYSKLQLWWHYFLIRAGRKVHATRAITLRAHRIRITHRSPLPAHADGAPVTTWPLDISVRSGALRIFTAPVKAERS